MAKEDKNLVLIDADSLIYIVGNEMKDVRIEILGTEKLNEFIMSILIATRCGSYMGFYGEIGSKNFRYDVAKTKPYKGNRNRDKEDWLLFWEPILKEHMKIYWKFQAVSKIEADDAVAIAHTKYVKEGKYNKVVIASPDKDLRQLGGLHYDYRIRIHLDIDQNTATRMLIKQMFTGDTTDNIPGLPSMGKVGAEELLKKYDDNMDMEEFVKECYYKHFTVTLRDKMAKKQEKDFLAEYKQSNNIKRLTAKIKSEALAEFKVDESEILSKKEIDAFYVEMKALLTMLTSEEEGKELGFILNPPNINKDIDWELISSYIEDLQNLPETQSFDFLNDL